MAIYSPTTDRSYAIHSLGTRVDERYQHPPPMALNVNRPSRYIVSQGVDVDDLYMYAYSHANISVTATRVLYMSRSIIKIARVYALRIHGMLA